MATIKSHTDIGQSKKLAEILPLESADMSWKLVNYGDEAGSRFEPSLMNYSSLSYFRDRIFPNEDTIPCWSLAALLGVLPKSLIYTPNPTLDGYCCKNIMHDLETYGDNPVDACYEMILNLNELNLLLL